MKSAALDALVLRPLAGNRSTHAHTLVASEALPYAKTGGLARLEAFAKSSVNPGHEVAVFLPRYRGVKSGKVIQKA